jgi:hypothetical protein
VLVSHELNVVSRHAHHVLCLKEGRIHCEGPPQTIVTSEMLSEVFGAEKGVYAHHHGLCHDHRVPHSEPLPVPHPGRAANRRHDGRTALGPAREPRRANRCLVGDRPLYLATRVAIPVASHPDARPPHRGATLAFRVQLVGLPRLCRPGGTRPCQKGSPGDEPGCRPANGGAVAVALVGPGSGTIPCRLSRHSRGPAG